MTDERLQRYKNTEWVFKSKRGRLSPLPNIYSMESVNTLTKEILGVTWNKIVLTLQKRDMHICVDKESTIDIERKALEIIKNNPNIFAENSNAIKNIAEVWLNWLKELNQKDLSELEDKELVEIYQQYRRYYKEVYGRYFTILVLETSLTAYLQKLLEDKTKDKAGAFTKLTSCYGAMHTKHEERDRHRVVKEIIKNAEWLELWKKSADDIETAIDNHETGKLVRNHLDNYFWITRDYEDPSLTKKDIIKRIKETLDKGRIEELSEISEKEEERINSEIIRLERELSLTAHEKQMFKTMRDGIFIKELRKKLVSKSLEYFDHVLKEIGKRTNLPIELTRMLVPKDLWPVIIEKKDYNEILRKRFEKSVYVVEDGVTHLFEGKQAEELYNVIANHDENISEFKGLSGAAGIARGPAKIVEHPSDFHKIKEGDIMITVQAVPSFIDTLMKCKGLVAEGGTGITSHPATLAREAGIPCVFRTIVATKVIKDGDIVEVDGDNGIVRILEKNKDDDNDIWLCNFSINNAGSQLLQPALREAFPYSVDVLFGGEKKVIKQIISVKNGVHINGAYIKEKEIKFLVDETIAKIVDNPKEIMRVHEEAYTYNDQHMKLANEYVKIDFSKMTDKELGEAYKKIINIQIKAHGHALVTTWFLESYQQRFSKWLLEKTNTILKDSDKDPSDIFSILTTLPKNSLALVEEIESLEIIKKIQNSGEKYKVLGWDNTLEMPDISIKQEMETHYQKWRYMPFNYLGPAYDREYYIEIWKGLLKENIDSEQKINELKQRPEKIKKQKQELIKELNIDEKTQAIFEVAADIAFLKGYRKYVIYNGMYALSFLLKEASKRLGIPSNDMYLLTDKEIYDALTKNNKVNILAIKERKDNHCFVYDYTNNTVQEYRGKESEEFLKTKNFLQETVEEIDELKGTIACSGYAKGIVKHINTPEDMKKMEEGDILVAHTTMPSLLPAMRKAAAFITEDGGITCHAAIVAREMKTPCITGIKTATKALKEGTLVEVDANKGVVKKVKE